MLIQVSEELAKAVHKLGDEDIDIIGPSEAYIYRINNVYRRVIYIKSEFYVKLTEVAGIIQKIFIEQTENAGDIDIQFDFNPMRII